MSDERREARAYLGLGGNIGDVRATIAAALDRLARHGVRVLARSADYRTPPWGNTDQQPFVNACAIVETSLPPHDLLQACLEVERELGRVRQEKWGPRVIDIDVLAVEDRAPGEHYAERMLDTPDLVVPHPYMLERAFVLVPLAEIAPDLMVRGRPVAEHVREFDTTGIVRLGADDH
jgi:2-amino-4-hydroxy-6-hydroxymethyldihydropteridine diphosphokinase